MTIYTENYPDIYLVMNAKPVYVEDIIYHSIVMRMETTSGTRFNACFNETELKMMLNVLKQRKV